MIGGIYECLYFLVSLKSPFEARTCIVEAPPDTVGIKLPKISLCNDPIFCLVSHAWWKSPSIWPTVPGVFAGPCSHLSCESPRTTVFTLYVVLTLTDLVSSGDFWISLAVIENYE